MGLPAERARLWWLRRRESSPEDQGEGAPQKLRRTPKLARLEAVLLVADGALSPRRLAHLATLADATEARTLVGRLNAAYAVAEAPFRVEQVAGGYRLLTLPPFVHWLGKLHQREADLKLSPPALETLTVIAYRQPITRADVEAIRGVQCVEMIRQLMERGLVRIGGEEDSLGRPYLYETTRQFLETFGLSDLGGLPLADRLRKAVGAVPSVEVTENGAATNPVAGLPTVAALA